MIIDHNREKLINAIAFFVTNTKHCGVTKLFKLLYFLDFEHYRITGRSVTGLDYYAWPMGPVPRSLKDEIDGGEPQSDFEESISVQEKSTKGGKKFKKIEAKVSFDPSCFSNREIGILRELASEYFESNADEMIEATHLERLPWHQVYEVEKRKQQLIPYELAARKDETELIRCMAQERQEIITNYK